MNKEDEKVLQPKIASREVTMHILKAFGLRMSKKLGQNFLIDARIVQGIVDAAEVKPGDRVLEIGPGIGTLTQGLAEAGADVTAVELDKKLPAVLKETLKAYDNVRIVPGDILKVNIPEIMGEAPFKVAANLPYYITTPILMALLERHLPITHMVTMVQKEVAERMTAKPGSRIYGALSVAVQLLHPRTGGHECRRLVPRAQGAGRGRAGREALLPRRQGCLRPAPQDAHERPEGRRLPEGGRARCAREVGHRSDAPRRDLDA